MKNINELGGEKVKFFSLGMVLLKSNHDALKRMMAGTKA
jgi:hypothetical protein